MKIKQIMEIICVYIFVLFFTIAFWTILPTLNSLLLSHLAKYLFLVVCALLPVLMCKIMKRPITTLGFEKERMLKQIFIAIGILIVLYVLFIGILPVLRGFTWRDTFDGKINNIVTVFIEAPYFLIFVGFGEEILFRGYFLERIKTITNSNIAAVVISSILFGIWHYPVGHSLYQVIVTTFFGVVWATARVRIKNCTTLSLGLSHGAYDYTFILLRFFCL